MVPLRHVVWLTKSKVGSVLAIWLGLVFPGKLITWLFLVTVDNSLYLYLLISWLVLLNDYFVEYQLGPFWCIGGSVAGLLLKKYCYLFPLICFLNYTYIGLFPTFVKSIFFTYFLDQVTDYNNISDPQT